MLKVVSDKKVAQNPKKVDKKLPSRIWKGLVIVLYPIINATLILSPLIDKAIVILTSILSLWLSYLFNAVLPIFLSLYIQPISADRG